MSEPFRKIVNYTTTASNKLAEFDSVCKEALAGGWQPYGAPFAQPVPDRPAMIVQAWVIYQPMTVELALKKFSHPAEPKHEQAPAPAPESNAE